MNAFMIKLSKKFEVLSFYKKILACVFVVIFLYLFWSLIIDRGLSELRESMLKESKSLKENIEKTNLKINEASEVVKRNPKQGLSQQVDAAKKTSAELDKKIHDKTVSMVSPKDMNGILDQLIQKSDGLIVLQMESIEKKILVQSKKTEDETGEKNKVDALKNDGVQNDGVQKGDFIIFQHGLSVEMSGGYFETLDFLKSVEKRHLSLVWDEINYEVVAYPKAKIKIMIHTLSLDEDFIGV